MVAWEDLQLCVAGSNGESGDKGAPFSDDAMRERVRASRRQQAEAKAAAEAQQSGKQRNQDAQQRDASPPKPADLSVADPLRYLEQAGLSQSGRTSNSVSPDRKAEASEATNQDAADERGSNVVATKVKQKQKDARDKQKLPRAPSGVRHMDEDVLKEADAGVLLFIVLYFMLCAGFVWGMASM